MGGGRSEADAPEDVQYMKYLEGKSDFTPTEFKEKSGPSFCRECTDALKEAGEKWCTACKT